jgi:hypothetical protein
MKRCLSFLLFLTIFYNCQAPSAYLNFVAIKDKIMQPFFTAKPTCGAMGLGLSLTYDMAVKGVKLTSIQKRVSLPSLLFHCH